MLRRPLSLKLSKSYGNLSIGLKGPLLQEIQMELAFYLLSDRNIKNFRGTF